MNRWDTVMLIPNSKDGLVIATHIVVVDDDARVRDMVARFLVSEGFRVSAVASGRALFETIRKHSTDLVILDVNLPGEDGVFVARELRAHSRIGIIMLTGRADVVDRVVGLEVGADDYITKPFHLRELVARIKSVLRRLRAANALDMLADADHAPPALKFATWRLDRRSRELTAKDGRIVPLTTGEFDLLQAFVTNPGRVLDRDRLMDLTKGQQWAALDRSIDNKVAILRKKIEANPNKPDLIKSVRGVGYIFTPLVTQD